MLHSGPATTSASRLVGERGNPQVDLAFKPPYPTDHRGVVSTFDVTPAAAPLMVSPRHAPRGHRVRAVSGVRFHAHGRRRTRPSVSVASDRVARRFAGVHRRASGRRGRGSGPPRLRPGRYDLVLYDIARDTHRDEARRSGSTAAQSRTPHLRPADLPRRQPVRVSWTRAPGNNLDWIGLFRCHRTCGGPGSYLVYRYTRTAIEGIADLRPARYLGEGSVSWPLPPGQYVARLLVDDSYHALGMSPRFRIVRR